jgi:hypothetical protein
MSDKVYAVVEGIVQFDPRDREANGKKIVDVAVKAVGSQALVNITIWPEFQLSAPIKKGDWVAADGEFTQRTYQDASGAPREGLQISAKSLVVVPGVPRAETQVVQAAAPVAAVAAPAVVQAPAGAATPAPLPF